MHQRARVCQAALDNGVLRCADPKRLQQICDGLSGEKIDALLRKWLRLLPHPYTAADRKAGYRYQISILQAEFSLTQVLDRPVTGRVFFEEVIRENLDLGRPSQVQLIFDRRINKQTPGRFRTRVITDSVVPSLHVDYKNTRIKQYHKEGRALHTETTIHDTRDFGIGKSLKNLSALRQIGFQAFSRTYARLMRPKLAEIMPVQVPPLASPLCLAFDRLTAQIDACCQEERLVA